MRRRPAPPKRYQATGHLPIPGAYGVVEVWHDTMLDRDVAIKWLTSHDGEEQLLNEWRILANAVSRHVVEIYDLVFDHHGVLFGIVMEFVPGKTLAEVAVPANKEQALQVVRLLYQFAKGLADLHSGNVVHRDVKPENVVIDASDRLKICDFGLSGPTNTLTLRSRATMGYTAPELHLKPAIVTLKSDVYSFGAVCWKSFTGGLPNVGRNGMPEASMFPLASIKDTVKIPSRLASLIDRCMAWTPADRPDIADVMASLRNELTKGKHVAFVTLGRGPAVMDTSTKTRKLTAGAISIQVSYDEYEFRVDNVIGEAYINNAIVRPGDLLPEGCLLTFGGSNLGPARAFAPFRQFTPEIVI
jgi:eukaryotic-like serine/threonine-protein kinase